VNGGHQYRKYAAGSAASGVLCCIPIWNDLLNTQFDWRKNVKDKTLLLLATMLITIGLSSSVYARTCKTGHPLVHTTGGCSDPVFGTTALCTGCTADVDTGGCGAPLGAANVCVQTTPPKHTHINAYVHRYYPCIVNGSPAICGACDDPLGAPGSFATWGSGANTGASCKPPRL